MINVVGYGEGIDPMDLKPKKYFIIRDSLTNSPIHYRIDSNQLLQHTVQMHKVTDIAIAK